MKTFTHSGFQCMTRKSPNGIPCGYVGIPKSHRYHGVHSDNIDNIEVHGGLTFSNYCKEQNHDLWWLGFDCSHAFDLLTSLTEPPYVLRSNKSEDYVEEQTKRLAEQLAEREK